MKKQGIALGLLALFGSSPVWASSDVSECEWWTETCGLATFPFYAPGNDTRSNLYILSSEKHHFASPFPALTADPRSTRATPFSIERLATTDGFSSNGSVVLPVDNQALMADARKMSVSLEGVDLDPTFTSTDVEIGRFISNNPATLQQFFHQLVQDPELTDEQRQALARERVRLLVDSAEEKPQPEITFPDGSHARAFSDYLAGVDAFYTGAFPNAEAQFTTLKQSPQSWVAETSEYMLFRVAINQITQNATDEYGMFDSTKGDRAAAALAMQRGAEYLSAHPEGLYAGSVQGLYRRINWYTGDYNKLAFNAEQAISQAKTPEALQSVTNELDALLLGNYWLKPPFIGEPNSPQVTFTQVLKRLRENYQTQQNATPVTAEELNGYKPVFEKAGMLPAWEYMQAAWLYYIKKDYAAVLKNTEQPISTESDTVTFSRQVLSGLAMQSLDKRAEAEAYWRKLLQTQITPVQKQYVEYQVAKTLVSEGKLDDIFAADSPVTNLAYRSPVLKMLASQELLRKQVETGASTEEQIIALHTLLAKELLNGDYQGYLQDKPRTSVIKPVNSDALNDVKLSDFTWDGSTTEKGYQCRPLDATVTILAKNPKDARALNCLGEYFRTTGLKVINESEYTLLDDLTKATSQYSGKPVSRLMNYQRVIAMVDAPPEDKSYALYRAVMCYAPSGYNSCDEQDIEKSERKDWFQQLKSDYRGNLWETRLNYYW